MNYWLGNPNPTNQPDSLTRPTDRTVPAIIDEVLNLKLSLNLLENYRFPYVGRGISFLLLYMHITWLMNKQSLARESVIRPNSIQSQVWIHAKANK